MIKLLIIISLLIPQILFSATKLKITKVSGDTILYRDMVYNFKIEALNSDNTVDTNCFRNVKLYSSINNDIEILEGSDLEGGDQIVTLENGVLNFGILCKRPETVRITAEDLGADTLNSDYTNITFKDFNFSDKKIIINEIMYRYASGNGARQWIELYNNSNSDINIQNWVLNKITPKETPTTNNITLPSIIVKANSYFVLIKDTSYFTSDFPDVSSSIYNATISSSSFLSSTKGILQLTDDTGKIVDVMYYNNDDYDLDYMQSLERVNPNFPSYDENNWSGCIDTSGDNRGVKGTPGKANSVYKSSADNAAIEVKAQINTPSPIFDLSKNELLKIDISINISAKIDVKIFDSRGTEVESIKKDYQVGNGTTTIYYDGKDSKGDKLKSGMYFIYVRYINDKTGHYGNTAKTLVIVDGTL